MFSDWLRNRIASEGISLEVFVEQMNIYIEKNYNPQYKDEKITLDIVNRWLQGELPNTVHIPAIARVLKAYTQLVNSEIEKDIHAIPDP